MSNIGEIIITGPSDDWLYCTTLCKAVLRCVVLRCAGLCCFVFSVTCILQQLAFSAVLFRYRAKHPLQTRNHGVGKFRSTQFTSQISRFVAVD